MWMSDYTVRAAIWEEVVPSDDYCTCLIAVNINIKPLNTDACIFHDHNALLHVAIEERFQMKAYTCSYPQFLNVMSWFKQTKKVFSSVEHG